MSEDAPTSGERQRTDNGKTNGNGLETDNEAAVLQRYEGAAREVEAGLCVPVSYDRSLLSIIPDEIIEKDYGCGDPSRYVREGETVLDLGSGSGKACYLMCQIVGPNSRVIGVDFNPSRVDSPRLAASDYDRLEG